MLNIKRYVKSKRVKKCCTMQTLSKTMLKDDNNKSLYLKKENYKMIKASLFKEDTTILNVCESNNRASKCRDKKNYNVT